MKRFLISDLSEVACTMYNNIMDGKFNDVMFIGYYDDAVSVIKSLLIFDESSPYHICIKSEDFDGYDKEYYVALDSELNIWCDRAYSFEMNNYFYNETECLFVADDCNSAILKNIGYNKNNIYEVSYDLEDECSGNCEDCKCSEKDDNHEETTRVAVDEDGKIRGFEKSWSTYEDGMYYHNTYKHYSNNTDMLKHVMENFDIKF